MNFGNSKKAWSETDQKRLDSENYLRNTDWYVIRSLETGKAIPDDILEKRNEARKYAG